MTETKIEIIKRTPEWWDDFFLSLAKHISTASKDPSTKVGAVITSGKRIISMGYNGLPESIPDSTEILNDRKLKYPLVDHAEKNAFMFADIYGIDVSGCTIYTYPFMPCMACYDIIKRYGIKRIVCPVNDNPRWTTHFEEIKLDCKKEGVELCLKELKSSSRLKKMIWYLIGKINQFLHKHL